MQGASGKLQAFGFCEYEQPDATLRCIRLLNEWPIADKKLVVSYIRTIVQTSNVSATYEILDMWYN